MHHDDNDAIDLSRRDALKTILVALCIDGSDKRGATPYEGSYKR